MVTQCYHIFSTKKNTALKSLSKHNLKSKSAILGSCIPLETEFGCLEQLIHINESNFKRYIEKIANIFFNYGRWH